MLGLLLLSKSYSQKFLFTGFNVEQGLGQSQATSLAQDQFNNLWITHLGGVSRFDGKNFKNYTTADGLQSNFCNTVRIDQTANVWIGTHTGLSVYDGLKFKNYILGNGGKSPVVSAIECDRQNQTWVLSDGRLYKADLNECKPVQHPYTHKKILALGVDADKNLLVVVETHGIIKFENEQWQQVSSLHFIDSNQLRIRRLYTGGSGKLYLVSNKGLFVQNAHSWSEISLSKKGVVQPINMLEDKSGRLWIATTRGILRVAGDEIKAFDSRNGFTDHVVYDLLEDTEGNYWFSTIGSGIIRYNGDDNSFFFDKEILKHIGVSGITRTSDGSIWFGTYGGGIRRYDGKSLQEFHIPETIPAAGIINFCLADKQDGIWIGTQGAGIWYLHNNRFKKINTIPTLQNQAFFSAHQSHDGQIIFSSSQGVYQYENNSLQLLSNEKLFANAAAFIGHDSILVGTPRGAYLLIHGVTKQFTDNTELNNATILSVAVSGDDVYIGTADKGLFLFSLSTRKIKHWSTRNGLSSDCIYAVAIEDDSTIWLSTGHFLDQLVLDKNKNIRFVNNHGKNRGILSPEGNTNSLLLYKNDIWVGTLNGLNYISTSKKQERRSSLLKVILTDLKVQNVKPRSGEYFDSLSRFYLIPQGLRLAHHQNHLTFTFQAASLYNVDEIRYQYKIDELEKDFSPPVNSNQVIYSSLPPGRYTFMVKASDNAGRLSEIMHYSFEIKVPFYQLWYFRLMFVVVLSAIAIFFFYSYFRWKEIKRLKMEQIKRDEQTYVRRRTAEDFHDDIGNKLTRINVLTEVLKNKINNKENVQEVIQHIQENTTSLYSSSRDLIWSLSNDEGSLYDLSERLIHFGNSVLANTDIRFEYINPDENLRQYELPPDAIRNLTFVLKEVMNNILKHAKPTNVRFSLSVSNQVMLIRLDDNGQGFDQSNPSKGYGLVNMNNRCQRIGAVLSIVSSPDKGTTITISLPITKS
jgi:signal transduction histidine kinase/ligand-binding sensor domain-containing protein